ncbi:MAG: NADH-quinone oxidoreductase subunit J [Ignavibacteria bacterium]|nr:NADH-quinone oxidoreductase subunit J [Ignavibacteria bacterium]MBT8382112.1 NADH-quinone oxidoreductase subunit J [Ignavibacteria bacterium]MBT8392024.1 NADH-quinone oxidoreductase subunit J [Ignavibacteria bacterium]NNJ51809.1 NADH-quinone oxidoreductase subunit J [Ignavibacteriaceae bacterium]NNL21878.1 NADH-quinone oxidoreductase subunit J [Ignavibacteriaceae bacterium]
MSLELILSIVFGGICAVTALLVITRINPVISALFLVVNFASLAGLYLILNAQFIAIAQIIVYAGAIMVFFLFVIMLLNPESEKKFFSHKPYIKIFTVVIVAIVFVQIIYMIFLAQPSEELIKESAKSVNAGTIEQIGRELFTNYVLPFEAAGYLLLAATIGALVIAKKKFE